MFSSKARRAQEAVERLNCSEVLQTAQAWQLGQLAQLGIGSELTAITYGSSKLPLEPSRTHELTEICLLLASTCYERHADPVQSLLAVGTEHGRLFVFGAPGVELGWDLGMPTKIRHLVFKPGSGFLCVVGE